MPIHSTPPPPGPANPSSINALEAQGETNEGRGYHVMEHHDGKILATGLPPQQHKHAGQVKGQLKIVEGHQRQPGGHNALGSD